MDVDSALSADFIRDYEAGIQKLQQAPDDPETPFSEIPRLILRQMVLVMRQTQNLSPWQDIRSMTRDLMQQLPAWRVLHDQMMDTYRFRPHQPLDISDPRFQAAYGFLLQLCQRSMLNAGLAAGLAQNVMMELTDNKGESELKQVIADARPSSLSAGPSDDHRRSDVFQGPSRGPMDCDNALPADLLGKQAAGMKKLLQALDDPETEFSDISRLIVQQRLIAVRQRLTVSPWEDIRLRTRVLTQQNQGWQMVHRVLMDAYRFRKNQRLDIASPQFRAAFGFFVKRFLDSMRGAGVPQDLAHNVLLQFRDLVNKREPDLRKAIAEAAIN